jgi:Transposase IS4
MKEDKYVMQMMSTYGTLERFGKEEVRSTRINGQKQQIRFQRPEVFNNHFAYRHMVDDHNNKRHSPISLEVTWATKKWENRVFAFLLAATEVNVMLASTYFYGRETTSFLDFRKDFAKSMIYNDYLDKENKELTSDERRTSPRNRPKLDHELMTLPAKTTFKGTLMVSVQTMYHQLKCSGCARRVQTYCRCTPGVVRCNECYARHIASI